MNEWNVQIDQNYRTHGESEAKAMNNSVTCCCGAADWRVYKSALIPPNGRIIICNKCNHEDFVEIVYPM